MFSYSGIHSKAHWLNEFNNYLKNQNFYEKTYNNMKPINNSNMMNFMSNTNNSMINSASSSSHHLTENMAFYEEKCLYCSRSLSNLSSFNKRIHMEQCKLKQMKKEEKKKTKETNNKPIRKRLKIEKNDL